jgi:Ni/Fe-hydrogenase subunit HybB-like protein
MVSTTANQKRASLISMVKEAIGVTINPGVMILGYLTLMGVVAGVWRMFTGLGGATHLTDTYPWGLWIGFDFTLIAFSGAGFTMAALVYVFRQEQFRPALRPAVLAGFLGYCAVLVLLILDLGRPDRFYNFLLYFNVHSPLFEICWCVLLYTTVLTLEVSPQLFERLKMHAPVRFVHHIIVVLAVLALTLSSLHQSTLGTLYLNMPYRLNALWYTPILPLEFFVSSVFTGLSIALIAYKLAVRFGRWPTERKVTTGLGVIAAAFGVLYLGLKLGDIIVGGKAAAFMAFDSASLLLWAELVFGVMIPLAIFLTPSLRRSERGQWLGALLFAGGTLFNRFNCTLFGQHAPAGGTYAPHAVEWLTTIGVISGAMLAWYLGVRFLAVYEAAHKR